MTQEICVSCERAVTLRQYKGEPIRGVLCGYCKIGIDAFNAYLEKTGKRLVRVVEPEDIDQMLGDTVYRVHHQPVKPMTRQVRRERWNRKGRKYG